MSADINNNQNHNNDSQQEQQQATFIVLAQYIKDLSFENPGAPLSLRQREISPAISIEVNVDVRPLEADKHEVLLSLQAKASQESETLFHAELAYGGIFHLENIPQEHTFPLLYIEAPRLLFPFARKILADATQEGGFPALMLDPIDFAGLFQQRMERSKNDSKPN